MRARQGILIDARSVLPQTLVIDKGNRIVRHFQGFNASYTPRLLREAIDELRQKSPNVQPSY